MSKAVHILQRTIETMHIYRWQVKAPQNENLLTKFNQNLNYGKKTYYTICIHCAETLVSQTMIKF